MLVMGSSGACIDPEPLFSVDDISPDGGSDSPPAVAAAESGGAPVSVPGSMQPEDAGLATSEGQLLPEGSLDTPPACDERDGGSVASCAGDPDQASPEPEARCNECLAEVCPAELDRCSGTEGCGAIVECARSSGCVLDECYCGNVNPFSCATTGQADGPCRAVMLAAPGAHSPNLIDPTAGPAAAAASALGECRLESDECRSLCGG